VIDALLAEDVAAAKLRAAAFNAEPIVLFGAGGVGRKAARALREAGKPALAFADNDRARWGTTVEELPVLSPEDAVKQHLEATFVVSIWGAGTHRFDQTRAQLLKLGASHVTHAAFVFWKYPERTLPHYALDLPHKILEQRELARRTYDLFADEASRAEYLAQLRWRLWLDFENLPSPQHTREYFAYDLFAARSDEVFVDGGAFDGDTVAAFIEASSGRYAHIAAIEADPKNAEALRARVANVKNVAVHEVALAARAGTLRFAASGSASSAVARTGGIEVRAAAIDELFGGQPTTLIKLDIEGAELDALEGAKKVIARDRPVLAVCAYHQQDHLFRVPLLLAALAPEHRLFLRAHREECFDLVCYAVPPERVR
jgi:FkbM family methyltransferase